MHSRRLIGFVGRSPLVESTMNGLPTWSSPPHPLRSALLSSAILRKTPFRARPIPRLQLAQLVVAVLVPTLAKYEPSLTPTLYGEAQMRNGPFVPITADLPRPSSYRWFCLACCLPHSAPTAAALSLQTLGTTK